MAIIINGRRIDPTSIGNGVSGSELIAKARASHGRRPIIESGGHVSQIEPNKRYSASELVDKRGRGAKLTSMPDRSKGYGLTGNRSRESRQIITEQVYDVATHMFRQGVDFDEENADWMVVPDYPLPRLAGDCPLDRATDRLSEGLPDASASWLLPAGQPTDGARRPFLQFCRPRSFASADPRRLEMVLRLYPRGRLAPRQGLAPR